MRILLICDYIEYGGAEVYMHTLIKILKKNGQNVKCIYFIPGSNKTYASDTYVHIKTNNIEKIVGKFIRLNRIEKRLSEIINTYNPETIILNSAYHYYFSIIHVVKKYHLVNIIHDYRPICPNANCLHSDDTICSGYKDENCYKLCHGKYSYIHIFLKRINSKRIEIFNQKWVDVNIAPSKTLAQKCITYGYRCICIHNPMLEKTSNSIPDENKKILYVGEINHNKGILEFADCLIRYNKDHQKKFSLIMAGKIDKNSSAEFIKIIHNENINYVGQIDHKEVANLMRNVYALVVPSLWMENYPTVILEAFSNDLLVIGSKRGGIIELLSDNRGILFDPLTKSEITEALDKLQTLSPDKYNEIVRNGKIYLKENNSLEIYWSNFLNYLNSKL